MTHTTKGLGWSDSFMFPGSIKPQGKGDTFTLAQCAGGGAGSATTPRIPSQPLFLTIMTHHNDSFA